MEIRLCIFLGLPDPDPLVRDTDPDPSLVSFTVCVQRTEVMLAKKNVNTKC
jgi:hypothetical protein